MKTETTEAILAGLHEENLGSVSGGTNTGKIGPGDARVKKALGFIQDAQLFAPKMIFHKEALMDLLNSIADTLTGIPEFSIAKALTLLGHARTTVKVMPKAPIPDWGDEERKRILLEDIDKAHSILDPLV